MSRLVGLFFGSFNPLHNGHLAIAGHMLGMGLIEELWFVVSPCNPFKEKSLQTSAEERCRAVERVIEALGDARVRLSRIELSLPIPSYTVNTLNALGERHPDCAFTIIMGGDSLRDLPRWREGERILEGYGLLVYPRGNMQQLPHQLTAHPNVTIVDAPLLPISSTLIREGIREGKNMRFYLPLT